METVLGVIGGSGLYGIDGLSNVKSVQVATPWGEPSAPLVTGELNGIKVVFLARHGKGHTLTPNEVNYRANIDALKRVGVTDILSVSACGSLREHLSPGMFVLVNQFIDNTKGRPKTFFGKGMVAHVSMAEPTCNRLGDIMEEVLKEQDIPMQKGGVYLAMEGPQFSNYAESMMYRSWGADVIGMTNMPEAKLAREAEICYQTIAMVTDFDCWHPDHGHVDVASVLKVLLTNSQKAKVIIKEATKKFAQKRELCSQRCDQALEYAICTAPENHCKDQLHKLEAIMGRVLTNMRKSQL